MNFDHENLTLKPRMNEETIGYLDLDQQHISEVNERGAWLRDVWLCFVRALAELVVAYPSYIGNGKYSKQLHRRIEFSGDPEQRILIPCVYRMALHQYQRGVLVGGLLPMGRIVGEPEPIVHPAFAATLTGARAPWSPPPAATKSVAEKAELTIDEIEAEMMRRA